jgi:hypothetical protein
MPESVVQDRIVAGVTGRDLGAMDVVAKELIAPA